MAVPALPALAPLDQRLELTTSRPAGTAWWIALRGELDLGTVSALEAVLAEVPETPDGVVLDLREVTFLDSTGLRCVCQARRRFPSLALVPGAENVQRIFTLTGVSGRFPTTVA
jgi:anti-sigma B factor antagonist